MRWTAVALAAGVVAMAAGPSFAALSATETVTLVSSTASTYTYAVTLNNTGTTTIGTSWFAWLPGEDFMPSVPTAITSPAGWQSLVTSTIGNAIQWKATTSASYLGVGGTLAGFGFTSADSPAVLAGNAPGYVNTPTTTTEIYSGAPFSDGGFVLVANVVPEPASLGLLAVGGTLALRRRRGA